MLVSGRVIILLGSLHEPWKVRPKTPRPTEEFRGVAWRSSAGRMIPGYTPENERPKRAQKGPQNDALENVGEGCCGERPMFVRRCFGKGKLPLKIAIVGIYVI